MKFSTTFFYCTLIFMIGIFMTPDFVYAEPDWESHYDGGGSSWSGGGESVGSDAGGDLFEAVYVEESFYNTGSHGGFSSINGSSGGWSTYDEDGGDGGTAGGPPPCIGPALRIDPLYIKFEAVDTPGVYVNSSALIGGTEYRPVFFVYNVGCRPTNFVGRYQDASPFGIGGSFPVVLKIDFDNDGTDDYIQYQNSIGPIGTGSLISEQRKKVTFPSVVIPLGTHKVVAAIDLKDSEYPGKGCPIWSDNTYGYSGQDIGCIAESSRAKHTASINITAIDPQPIGEIESLGSRYRGVNTSCTAFKGWVSDASEPNTPVQISLIADGRTIQTVSATTYRPDADAYSSGGKARNYNIATPSVLKDGATHTIQLKAHNIGIAGSANDVFLVNAPWLGPKSFTLNCPALPPIADLAGALSSVHTQTVDVPYALEGTATDVGALDVTTPFTAAVQFRYGSHAWAGPVGDDFIKTVRITDPVSVGSFATLLFNNITHSKSGRWFARLVVDTGREIEKDTDSSWSNNATNWIPFEVVSDTIPTPACSDTYDNDGDGLADYPNDPGCVSINDDDETDSVVVPTITADPPLVRKGETVTISWDNVSPGCTLSGTLAGKDASVPGSSTITPTGQTTITITCGSLSDSVTVKVLPELYET